MKSILFLFAFAVLTLMGANDCKIVTSDGRVIQTSQIKLRPNDELEYLSPNGKTVFRLSKGRYRYAWIPKPAPVTSADLKFREHAWKEAAAAYSKAGETYKLLGWDVYCTRMEANALSRSGEKKVALLKLRQLKQKNLRSPEMEAELQLADALMIELLIDLKHYDEAEQMIARQLKSDNPDLVFAAFFNEAVIQQNRGRYREAAITFYQTALLFPHHSRRPEALYNSWSLFTELKDPSAAKIADLLNRQYPDNPYAKKTFR